jgi:predicted ester cyclase
VLVIPAGQSCRIEAYRAYLSANAAGAFTGMHLDVKAIITDGDQVVVRFINSGTQTGPFMGARPSGRHAEWLGIGIYTVHDGKISEAWFGEDILGMLLQLGAVSLPA